jgi:hypothetical protein
MPDQETLAFIGKLTAEISAIALVVSELLAAQCQAAPDPTTARLRELEKRIQEFLARNAFGPDSQNARQMQTWAAHRAEVIFRGAQTRLA